MSPSYHNDRFKYRTTHVKTIHQTACCSAHQSYQLHKSIQVKLSIHHWKLRKQWLRTEAKQKETSGGNCQRSHCHRHHRRDSKCERNEFARGRDCDEGDSPRNNPEKKRNIDGNKFIMGERGQIDSWIYRTPKDNLLHDPVKTNIYLFTIKRQRFKRQTRRTTRQA